MKDHLGWIIPLLIFILGVSLSIEHRLVDDGERRIITLEFQMERINELCCDELK